MTKSTTKSNSHPRDENTNRKRFYIAVDVPKRETLSQRVAMVRTTYTRDTKYEFNSHILNRLDT